MKVNQKTLLKDDQVKVFHDLGEMIDFLDEQDKESIWKRCYIKEITTVPVQSNPMFAQTIMKDIGISENCPIESVIDCMNGLKVALRFPNEVMECYPLSTIAYPSLSDRAGISGRSLSSTSDTSKQKEMPPENKAEIFNKCFELYKSSKCLVLLRDNKVLAVLSGDESDYSILRANKLAKVLQCNLDIEFPKNEFIIGNVSQEFVSMDFNLNDKRIKNSYMEVMLKSGISCNGAEVLLQFVTSDVGLSAAKLIPMIQTNDGVIPIGSPLQVMHKNNATIGKFDDITNLVAAKYRESVRAIENLTTTKINHSAGCLRAVANYLGLPRKASLTVAENVTGKMTAYHIYWYLNEIQAEYERSLKTDVSPRMHLRMQEDIAKAIFINYSEFDHPFEWSKKN